MARWLVEIEGDRVDLEEFPLWFPTGPVHAAEEKGKFVLVGQRLNEIDSADSVRNLAIEVLDQFAAVISLLWQSLRKPTVGDVYRETDDGRRSTFVFLSGGVAVRTKVHAVGIVAGAPSEPEGPTQAQELLGAVKTAPRLYAALLLWAERQPTWSRLYRVLEEIELDLDVPVNKRGLCSAVERERFTRSANAAEVAGSDARHAGGRFEPPSDPMSLSEATSFIGRLIEAALRQRPRKGAT
jgi:hypothetical protein